MTEKKTVSLSARLTCRFFLILLLCLVSMVGVTYALFTSDPEDGTIGINVTSGRVEIDIENDAGVSIVGSALHLSPDGRLMEDVTFEPGATVYTEGFRVVNEGSITVNFRMCVSRDASIDETEFLEAFDVFVTKTPNDLNSAEPIYDFTGTLGADGETDLYHLVVRMKDTAGNKFQGVTYEGIGVTVFAVQGNAPIS